MSLPPPGGGGKLPAKRLDQAAPPPPASCFVQLPDDVVAEILVRLPARSVCRLRAVCRSWRSLASSPAVLRAHAGRAAGVPAVVCFRLGSRGHRPDCGANVDVIHFNFFRDAVPDDDAVADAAAAAAADDDDDPGAGGLVRCLRSLSFNFSRRVFSVFVGSWDGILCVEIRRREAYRRFPVDSYVLFNPLTRAYAVVAAPSPARHGVIIGAFSHQATGAFHLLHAQLDDGEFSSRILKVGDPAWRELPAPAGIDMPKALLRFYSKVDAAESTAFWYTDNTHWLQPRGQPSVALHGNLHWLHQPIFGLYELLVFDTLAEEFGTMDVPKIDNVRVQRICVTSAGKLCLLALPESMTKMETWVLEDYHGEERAWELKRRIDTPVLGNWYIQWPWTRAVEVVGTVGAGGEHEELILHNQGNLVTIYNVQLQSCRDVKLDKSGRVKMHTESLVPGEVVFGAASCPRLMPEECPGVALLLSTVDDVAFAACPAAVRLADVDKRPRVCVLSWWWCIGYRMLAVSSAIVTRMVRRQSSSCFHSRHNS